MGALSLELLEVIASRVPWSEFRQTCRTLRHAHDLRVRRLVVPANRRPRLGRELSDFLLLLRPCRLPRLEEIVLLSDSRRDNFAEEQQVLGESYKPLINPTTAVSLHAESLT